MNYQNFFLYDTTGAQLPLQLRPTAKFTETQITPKVEQLAVGGKFHTYLPGANGYEWSVPLEFVNSATRAQINTWWAAQTELVFSTNITSSNPSVVGSAAPMSCIVRIANMMEPLGQNPAPRLDLFFGGLILKGSRGTAPMNAMPFILDDPVLGKLDQPYNKLI